jgi:hypothetical protein
MSAYCPKQTWPRAVHMSAFGGKAEKHQRINPAICIMSPMAAR